MAAPLQKKLSLEVCSRVVRFGIFIHHHVTQLGGKNPCLIFADVDVGRVAKELVRSSFTNQGEICLCSSRVYVQKAIFDEFVERFKACNDLNG